MAEGDFKENIEAAFPRVSRVTDTGGPTKKPAGRGPGGLEEDLSVGLDL